MPYPAGTILTRANPVPDLVGEDGSVTESPLNKLRVIGPSPVRPGPGQNPIEEWDGRDGEHLIVAPVDTFAANQVAPEISLREDYEAEYPVDEEPVTPQAKAAAQRAALESPEAVFAREARGQNTATTRKAKAAAKA